MKQLNQSNQSLSKLLDAIDTIPEKADKDAIGIALTTEKILLLGKPIKATTEEATPKATSKATNEPASLRSAASNDLLPENAGHSSTPDPKFEIGQEVLATGFNREQPKSHLVVNDRVFWPFDPSPGAPYEQAESWGYQLKTLTGEISLCWFYESDLDPLLPLEHTM